MDLKQTPKQKIYLGTKNKKGLVIIGAGPSGILATKHMKKDFDLLTLEAKTDLGGIWNRESELGYKANYDRLYKTHPAGIYQGLSTNNTKQCLYFKDFPNKANSLFLKGTEFLNYMRDYSDHFHLRTNMQFNTLVARVRLIENLTNEEMKDFLLTEEDKKYKYVVLTTPNIASENNLGNQVILCDYILCCTGAYNRPCYPKTEGSELFTGEQIHSHDYQNMDVLREKCENKRVVVVGFSFSAKDIVKHLTLGFNGHPPVKTKTLYQLVRNPDFCKMTQKAIDDNPEFKYVRAIPSGIKSFLGGNRIRLENQIIEADIVIWATGYNFNHPFLNPKDNIITEDEETDCKMIFPLFLRTFSVNQPTFAKTLAPFVYDVGLSASFERQVMMVKAVFNGETELPSREEMLKSIEDDIKVLEENGLSKAKINMHIRGIRDHATLSDKWFKYTNIAKKDTQLDDFMARLGDHFFYTFTTGEYYHTPEDKNFTQFEDLCLSSDRY